MQRNRRTVLWAILGSLWLVFIWGNSLQTAAESSQQSRGLLEILMPLLSRLGLPEELMHTLLRKLAHMAEFGVLGILWAAALLPTKTHSRKAISKHLAACILICLGAAAVDETIQLFVPGRSGELRDVGIDLIGSVLGMTVVAIMMQIFGGKNKRKVE